MSDPEVPGPPARKGRVLDTRGAQGVLVGDFGFQVNFFEGTWTDPVVSPPLTDENGTVDSPYRGLSPFEQWDARFFFGRETVAAELVEQIARKVDEPGPLVVSGVSGAGKSSLLRAGVLPRIRDGKLAIEGSSSWPCLVFTPTANPLDQLAERMAPIACADADAIRRNLAGDPTSFTLTARQAATAGEPARLDGAHRLLLVVDQFEQLFTRCTDEDQRRAFITALHAAATGRRPGPTPRPGALVVLVVRSDFEPRCAEYTELEAAVQDRYLLTAMTERQLRLAISEPARRAGASVENELVEVLLAEMLDPASAVSAGGARRTVVSGAGALPLLSHALDQAWRDRNGEALTLADYRRTGGIEGALAESADRAYQRLTPGQQEAARRAFTRLVTTGAGGADTANRVAHAELMAGQDAADVEKVLEAFAEARLLALASGTVEVSHEVLLTAWPLLRGWLDDTRTDRKVRTRLADAAEEWNRNTRDRSYLYQGALLDTATATADRIHADPRHHPPLGRGEREFLRASTRARRLRTRTRRLVTAVLTVLAVTATTLAAVAVYHGHQLAGQLATATAEALGRESQSRAPTDIAAATQLALAAWRSDPTSPQARTALANAYVAMSSLDAEVTNPLDGDPIGALEVKGDTAVLASEHRIAVLTEISGPAPRRWAVPDLTRDPHLSLSLSPDGRWLAYLTQDGKLQLRDAPAHSEPRTLATGQRPDERLAFSPDGNRLAAYDGEPRVWDVATGQPLPNGVGTRLGTDVAAVWLTPDPTQILVRHGAAETPGTRLALHSLADGSVSAAMPPGALVVRDGSEVVSCDRTQPDDIATRPMATAIHLGLSEPPTQFPVDSESCSHPVFSSDGGWLITTITRSTSPAVLRLTDLRNGLTRQVTVTSYSAGQSDSGAPSSVAGTLGVSSAVGEPSVLYAHGTSVLRLGSQPTLNDPRAPRIRELADGGRYVSVFSAASRETDNETVAVEDAASGRRIATVPGVPSDAFRMLIGNSLWLGNSTGDVWRIDRYQVSPLRKVASFTPPAPPRALQDWGYAFVDASVDQRPTMLFTVRDGVLAALEPTTGRPLAPPVTIAPPDPGDETHLLDLAVRPGHPGQLAVSSTRDVEIWDARDGHKVATIPVRAAGTHSVVFDPSGRLIAVLTENKTIELWDLETVAPVHRPIPSAGAGTLLGFDADGYLDTLGALGTFDAEGERLAFLDVDRGQEAGAMILPKARARTTVLPRESVTRVAGDAGDVGEARSYELPPTAQAWHDTLCAAADRPFTEAESKLLPPDADRDPPCR